MYLHVRTRYRKNYFEIPDNWTRNAFGFSFENPTLEVPCSKKQQFQNNFSYSVPYRADFKYEKSLSKLFFEKKSYLKKKKRK